MGKDKSNLTIEQRLLNYHTRLQGVSTDLAIKLLAVMSLTDSDVKDLLISELPKQKDSLKAELKRLPKIIEKITAIRKKSYDAGKDLIFDTVAKVVSKCTDVTAQAV
ncbi:MAG: hypothetical protein Q4G03_09335, partial [Planctomycetia bacterium]|nr:hypothetical protein [Planctomycetia bacterium]